MSNIGAVAERTDPTAASKRRPIGRPFIGSLLALAALPALVVLPEVGLPLMFVALRLLATRFAWAARAEVRLRRAAARFHSWFRRQSRAARLALVSAAVAVLALFVWWTVAEFV